VPSIRWLRFVNGIPPKTHLASLISPLIIRITNSATYFSLKVYISTRVYFLNSLLENCDGDKEGRDCANLWLISSQLSGCDGT
jgi:hypothetical protein